LANTILKKGERANEPFVADKIRVSLERAAHDSGISEAAREKIVRETYYETIVFAVRCTEVSSTDIRNRILQALTADGKDERKNAVAAAWVDHERRFK
jgi:transcriptional regulator NrdR family protein